MPTRKPSGINISGKIEAGIANIGGTQVISGPVILNIKSYLEKSEQKIGDLGGANADEKEELTNLVNQLKDLLVKTPKEFAEEAEKVAKRVDAIIDEAAAKKPDKEMLQITGESLKKAAENIAGAMPIVLTIATQIVQHIFRFNI